MKILTRALLARVLALLALALPVVSAHADVRVESADGRVLLRASAARVAAWKSSPRSLVLLAQGSGHVDLAAVPRPLQAEAIEQNGYHGVIVRGVEGAWTALQQGDQWLLRSGKPQQPSAGALLLKDGWRVDGKPVSRLTVDVDGARWNVAFLETPLSVMGSVVGLVRREGSSRQVADDGKEAKKPRVAAVSEGSALPEAGMKVVSVEQMLARIQPAAGPASAHALQAPEGLVGAVTPAGGDVVRVPFHKAGALAALGEPALGSEPLGLLPSLDVYVPGRVVSLSIPDEFLRMAPASSTLPPLVEEQLLQTLPVTALDAGVAADPHDGGHQAAALQGDAVEKALPEKVGAEKIQAVRMLFPPRDGRFQDALAGALQVVAEAEPDSAAERRARLDLAAFYLAWQRPEEALAVITLLPHRADGLPEDPMARLYGGLAALAMKRVPSPGTFDQQGVLAGDAALWRAVLASRTEDYATALKQWPRERGILPRYPDYLRESALIAQATALVRVGDKKQATKVVDGMVGDYDAGTAPAALVRLQGLVRLGTPDESQGLDFLAKAAADERDPAQAYRAKYEFVQALRQRHELADSQVITYLEDLWLDWRGDNLERDVLGTLADLYDKTGQPREALERWQVLVRAYPDLPDINLITDRMTQAFVNVFDPENPQTYDLLTYLGLYYDFRELLPTDTRGDKVQEQVAKLLMDATLWDRAAPVLEQLLNYRPLDTATQSRLTLLLAEVYRRQGHAAEAIKLLDKWQRLTVKTDADLRVWHLAQARSLLDLNRPDSAKRELAKLGNDQEALKLRVEADWKQKNWKGAAESLQAQLKPVTAAAAVSDTAAQLAIFQLAYAYGQLKDGAGLDTLRARYADVLHTRPELADGVNAVSAVSGLADVDGGGALAPLTVAMADINSLTTSIGQLRLDDKKVLDERDDYNRKMEYMDLLPPPSI